jgi:hypothetical protein
LGYPREWGRRNCPPISQNEAFEGRIADVDQRKSKFLNLGYFLPRQEKKDRSWDYYGIFWEISGLRLAKIPIEEHDLNVS